MSNNMSAKPTVMVMVMMNSYSRQMTQKLLLDSTPAPPATHDAIQNLTLGEDDAYFDSYSHFGIHEEMLKVRNTMFSATLMKVSPEPLKIV